MKFIALQSFAARRSVLGSKWLLVPLSALLSVGVAATSQQSPQKPATARITNPPAARNNTIDNSAKDPANLAGERVSAPSLADTLPINHGTPALAQLLLKLRTRASIMLIVAHPDDEDGGMITYESRGQGARVAMLTLNRGEGGQNLMSGDFDDALGLIRTQELLAAGRYMGNDQMFTSVADFGFSKTREESLEKWGHDRVLYDAVRAVRLYRPLVTASVFVGGVTDGHGQHQVAGEINQEVFTAAADPNVFPEMIQQGLLPWAPLKVYARAPFARIDAQGMFDYATGKYSPAKYYNYVTKAWSDTQPKAAVVIHEGEVSTAPGMDGQSYVQFARKGLAQQKSQNGGASRGGGGGAFDSAYARYGSRIPNSPATEQSFFDGIDVTFPGIADLAPSSAGKFREALERIDQQFATAQKLFDPAKPELTAPPLRTALGALDSFIRELEDERIDDLPAEEKFDILHELRIKRVQCNNALVLAHGIGLEATLKEPGPGEPLLTTQKTFKVAVSTSNAGLQPVNVVSLQLQVPFGARGEVKTYSKGKVSLTPRSTNATTLSAESANGLPPTRPYFSRPGIEQPYYDVADAALLDAPVTPSPLNVLATIDDQGVRLQVAAAVAYPTMAKDTVATSNGTRLGEPVAIVPPISIALPVSAGITSIDKDTFPFAYSALNSDPNAAPAFRLELPPLWTFTLPPSANHRLATTPPTGRFSHEVAAVLPDDNAVPYKPYSVTVVADLDGKSYREGYRTVSYPGIPGTNLYSPSTFHIVAADVHTPPLLRVGYLPGTGDDVPSYLPDIGVTPTLLTTADLTPDKIAQYDAVVLGVRAYAAHPELAGAGSKPLLDYAKEGGVVIVQYNTARYGDADAPYPIEVPGSSDMNVVVETDPVNFLAPSSPVLIWPNHLTTGDFNGWVEERGHGFARSWAPQYQALLETHDPGQAPERGGLLVARVGKGYYVYTALAIYRQLPEAVPGAYRLMANLLSLGRNPGMKAAFPAMK